MRDISAEQLARMVDASGGRAAATADEMNALYPRLAAFHFAAVMVEPRSVASAAEYFHLRAQRVGAAISSPLGAMTTQVKLIQAGRALADGADELDVAMDLSAFRSGDYGRVTDELKALRDVAGDHPIKVIGYSAVLAGDAALRAAELILDAGIRFLVTDPGYGYATAPEQVRAIKARFGASLRVVASGEIRTHQGALAVIEAGADRIGTDRPFAVLGVEH